jgi:hypothetical protein
MEPMPRASNAREGAASIAQAEATRDAMAASGLHHAAEFGPALAFHTTNVASATVANKGAAAAIASRTGYASFSI